jgi:hypothetical protein
MDLSPESCAGSEEDGGVQWVIDIEMGVQRD